MSDEALVLLEESRKREKDQAHFYRRLASMAGSAGADALTDRFNELHADEQHHLSRLTARIFEMEGVPAEIPDPEIPVPALDDWEGEARRREEGEVAWYGEVLEKSLDPETRGIFQEILESEEHHARELAGKWMSA